MKHILTISNLNPFSDAEGFPHLFLSLPHIDHTPNAAPVLHIRESLIDTLQRLSMRDELVDLELAGHIIVD